MDPETVEEILDALDLPWIDLERPTLIGLPVEKATAIATVKGKQVRITLEPVKTEEQG